MTVFATFIGKLAQLLSPAKAKGDHLLQTYIGLVPNPLSKRSQQLQPRIHDAQTYRSVCPYCAVGCGQRIYVQDGRVIDIEGDSDSPVSGGCLCPKGAASFELVVNPNRWTTVKYRAPYATDWEEKPLDWAMDRIAQLVYETREATFQEKNKEGKPLNNTLAIGSLGGATLDNEENYLITKLFHSLGMVCIENQARI
ncbi:MAG: dehydrogenase [Ktedonobacteraceae bacterium]|nr:dehydrogenase [Ktedonobacteraceae bacterium]MBO0790635.1 dehydrogenase [Ktedonobacteraceae bacterium]